MKIIDLLLTLVFTFQQPSNLGEAEGPAQVCVEVQSANSPVDTLINVTSLPNTAGSRIMYSL